MQEGDKASYGHVSLHEYEHPLRVVFEVLETRSFENGQGDHVDQWHLKVTGYDRIDDEDAVTEEVVISINEVNMDREGYVGDHDVEYSVLMWIPDENPRRSVFTVRSPNNTEYPWEIDHDGKIADYSVYDSRATITGAVLRLLEEICTVF